MTSNNEFFGVDIDEPYSPETARGSVLSGISQYMKPHLQKARGNIRSKLRGYHAPTIEGNVINPLLATGAESVRKSMTDLFFKESAEERRKKLFPHQLKTAKYGAKTAKSQYEASTVICTALYKQGLLSMSHIKADLKFLKYHVSRETHDNYLRWSIPVSNLLLRSKFLCYLIYPIVRVWSEYMKKVVYNNRYDLLSSLGFLVHNIGINFGKLYKVVRGNVKWVY